jgi:nitrite reductase/ring-hydroxylating ferredoxin subunit
MSSRTDRKHLVCRAEDLPSGERVVVELEGRSVGVFNVDGRYFALRNRCPHQGAALCLGNVVGRLDSDEPGDIRYDRAEPYLRCPWHGWEFDMDTGQSWFDPRRMRTQAYPVSVERHGPPDDAPTSGGRQPGPHVADTYSVTVEDEYVFVTLERK